ERDRRLGRFSDALEHLRDFEAVAETRADSLHLGNAIGRIHLLTGRMDRARDILNRVRMGADEGGPVAERIESRINLALTERIDGHDEVARHWALEVLDLARAIGDSASVERSLAALADLALAGHRPADALAWYERALAARPRRDPE